MHTTESVIPYFYINVFTDSQRDVQALRKGMVGELFIMFMLYVCNLAKNHFVNPPSNIRFLPILFN